MQSLLKAGLIEEVGAGDHQPTWRTADTGERYALRATQAGLEAVGNGVGGEDNLSSGADGIETSETVPTAATRADAAPTSAATRVEPRQPPSLRAAAQALLQAWDATGNGPLWLIPHVDALRAAVTVVRAKEGSRQPRPDTKRATVLALLRRAEGATVAQIVEATGLGL